MLSFGSKYSTSINTSKPDEINAVEKGIPSKTKEMYKIKTKYRLSFVPDVAPSNVFRNKTVNKGIIKTPIGPRF